MLKSIRRLVQDALNEDSYRHDLSSAALPRNQASRGEIVAEQELVVSGISAARLAFQLSDPSIRILRASKDGQNIRPGSAVLSLAGRSRSLLSAERTALNFLGKLSGIATLTRSFVKTIPKGSRAKILDTRKTTPLFRVLEKAAVRHGGGTNHRMSLGDAVLLKDNHVLLMGGVHRAVRATRQKLGPATLIEVEVQNLPELKDAIAAGADRVLLDNMTDEQIRRAIQQVGGKIPVEVSGGITIERIPRLARLGVDFISVGALTHSAPAAKLSMNIVPA